MSDGKLAPTLLLLASMLVLCMTAGCGGPQASDTTPPSLHAFLPSPPWEPIANFYPNGESIVAEKMEIRPGLYLVVKRGEYSPLYFIERGGMGRWLATEVYNAEVSSVTPDRVELRCFWSDSGFRGFPFLVVYDVTADVRQEELPLYLDCREPFRFNYFERLGEGEPLVVRGHEVTTVNAEHGSIALGFKKPAGEPFAPDVPPETVVSFQSSSDQLRFLFVGAILRKEDSGETRQLVSGSSDLWDGVELRQTAEGVELLIKLDEPVLYSVDYGSDMLSMKILLKPM